MRLRQEASIDDVALATVGHEGEKKGGGLISLFIREFTAVNMRFCRRETAQILIISNLHKKISFKNGVENSVEL